MAKDKHNIPDYMRLAVVNKCNNRCNICGKRGFLTSKFGKVVVVEKEPYKKWINEYDDTFIFEHRSMEFDHIIPLSKGGKTELKNLQILCRKCNRSKGNKIGTG